MSIYTILQELTATRSRNDKEAILQREVANDTLKRFFKLSLDPFINFFQKKTFAHKSNKNPTASLEDAMQFLKTRISARVVTGNDAIAEIQSVLNALSNDDAKCMMMIMQKDPRAGLGISTVNKIWPGLILEYPCLLATAWDDKLAAKLPWTTGCFSQLKSDGLRVNIVIDHTGGVTVYTRAGNELDVFGVFDCLGHNFKSVVLDGELLTINPVTGKFNNRQTSNGTGNKAVKGTLSQAEAATLHVVLWDSIPLLDFMKGKSELQYKDRWGTLLKLIQTVPQYKNIVSTVPSRIVHSINQAQEHYQEMLSADEEGTMVKSPAMTWSSTRSKLQLKLKDLKTCDARVVGFTEGTGKLVGNLGSLDIATDDGLVAASMSGFSMKLRSEIWANLTGKDVSYIMVIDGEDKTLTAKPFDTGVELQSIIEVKYNQLIKSRDSDTWSLFLPRFSKERPDKKVTNTYGELV